MRTPYTVIGGERRDRVRKYPFPLSVLILSRGGRLFMGRLLERISTLGIGETLWIEGPADSRDLASLSRDFPRVRFLTLQARTSRGAMVNIGMAESRAPAVLCMWSDMGIGGISHDLGEYAAKSGAVCLLPMIRTRDRTTAPTLQSPVMQKKRLGLRFRTPRTEGERSLFPFDYCGIYNTELFMRMGGFDPDIPNPYWQKMDFGFRCGLWGERISATLKCTLTAEDAEAENATPDESYRAFFLKNLAVAFRREMGLLPRSRFPEYALRAGTGLPAALQEFKAVREWVRENRSRFRMDSARLLEKWSET